MISSRIGPKRSLRGVASAAYSFMRFGGAAVAPWLAGVLGERINAHVPFWVGAGAVLLGAVELFTTRGLLAGVDAPESAADCVAPPGVSIPRTVGGLRSTANRARKPTLPVRYRAGFATFYATVVPMSRPTR